jgi:type VII secretion protein EccB
MATKKDLVEAYSFSRRRLVTAFVSGAPGGREVEPARPGRTIVAGLALAVLLVAGAAIAGIFSPSVPDDWADSPGLIVSKETGAAYVITEDAVEKASGTNTGPVLRPVINITSAMLILGSDVTPEIVPQSAIDAETIGDDIGILNAPASVPTGDLLIEDGWTACTDERHGIRMTVTESPGVRDVPGSGFVVESDNAYYVIARARPEGAEEPRAYSYRLPDNRGVRDDILGDLGLEFSARATSVSQDWLAVFPAGGALEADSFELDGTGDPVTYAGSETGVPDGARVGDYLEGDEGAFLLTEEGPAPLDPFALAVYANLSGPDQPRRLRTDDLSVGRALEPYLSAHWPDTLLEPVFGEHCARLQPRAGEAPVVELATDPTDEASSTAVDAGERSVAVDPGRGAYVLSGDWNDRTGGSPYLIDAKGNANALVGSGTPALLGYDGFDAPVVPDAWVELFDEGVPLSQDGALCPPDPVVGRTCD